MKIIIAGAGVIGFNLAKYLTEENHEIYLIEANEEIAEKVHEKLDVKVIIGEAADPETLKKVNVNQADMLIAVTTSDESNLVVCSLATAYGVKRRIARVRNTALSHELNRLGFAHFNLDEIINPEEVAADAIVKTINAPGASEVADFADGKILLRAFNVKEGSPLFQLKIADLRDEDFPWPFLIISVNRCGEVIIPKGDSVLLAGDLIYVLLPAQSLGEFLTFVNPETRLPKKVVIYGASQIGETLAVRLSGAIKDVTILEEDINTAEDTAGRLQSVRVIRGSAAESDILNECGIEAADVFIATSNNDHSNLVSAVLAKKMGAKFTIITSQHPDYMTLVDALDIDAIINPRILAAHQILRLVRGKSVQSVATLMDWDAEAMEFFTEENAIITQAPLKDLRLPKDSIIGAVCTEDGVILAKGNTHIKPGERVIVFCQHSAIKKLQGFFVGRKAS